MPVNPNAAQLPSATRLASQPRPAPPPKRALSGSTNATPLSSRFGALVVEIAARLEPIGVILRRHGISKEEFKKLRHTDVFKAALTDQMKAFNGFNNIADRVRMKAQLITEDLLDHMYSIASQGTYPSSSRVAAFAQIKQLTGMDRPDATAPQQKFSLTINLADKKSITLEHHQEPSSAGHVEPLVPLNYDPTDDGSLDDDADFDETELELEPATSTIEPPIVDRGWNSFTTRPGPKLNKPGPPGFERMEKGSATQTAAAYDDD